MISEAERPAATVVRRLLNGEDAGVIAVFAGVDDRARATAALREAGFADAALASVTPSDLEQVASHDAASSRPGRLMPVGAAVGAAGAIVLESSVLAFPAAAPVPVGGTLVAAIIGAAVGATAGRVTRVAAEDANVPDDVWRDLGRDLASGKRALAVAAKEPLHRERARLICRRVGALKIRASSPDSERVHFIRGFADFAPQLRSHWQTRYAPRGEPFEVHEPRYRFGWELAHRPDFRGRNWKDAEGEIRAEWERRSAVSWEEALEAVRRGWIVGGGTADGEI